MTGAKITQLKNEIAACTHCTAHLPHGPRPVVQFSGNSQIIIIGQAPGSKVHASGIAWDDPSGDRLRQWTGLSKSIFYDPAKIALVPMGFCYPGKGKSSDLPPRKECAPLWHEKILGHLPDDKLTLLVGSYAQQHYLRGSKNMTMTQRVREFDSFGGNIIPLPHPSWRSTGWMRKNPWYEDIIIPKLQAAINIRLSSTSIKTPGYR